MTPSAGTPSEEGPPDALSLVRQRIEATDNPWEILELLRPVPLPDRPQFLQRFLDLACHLPAAEQDALTLAGRDIFRYRVATARSELDKKSGGEGRPIATEATVITNEWMAELAHRPHQTKPTGFLVYTFEDDSTKWADTVEVDKKTYVPPLTALIDSGTVLLPSGCEDYGSDWNLFTKIRDFLDKWIQLDNPLFRNLVVAYILMTWVYDRFDALPYLRVQGDFSSGKSRLLQTAGSVCLRPVIANGGATPAALFRIIHKFRPTLVIDEADFSREEAHEITRILNTGYQRGFRVLRAERTPSDNFDVAAYECFGPKIIASRRRFADLALESRCLSHTMPLLSDLAATVPFVLTPEFHSQALQLRNMLLLWRFRNWRNVWIDPTLRIEGAEPRINQIIQPLIASVPEGKARAAIVEMARGYSRDVQSERRESLEGIVAQALLLAWRRSAGADRIPLRDITPVAQEDFPRVGPERIGNIVRRILGFETQRIGGVSWVVTPIEKVRALALRYGLLGDVPPSPPDPRAP